jgi:hypothetical protein
VCLTELSETRAEKAEKVWNGKVWNGIVSDPASDYNRTIEVAFSSYSEWWDSRAREAKSRLKLLRRGLLPGDFAAEFQKGGFRFAIVSLNTTFLQLEGGRFQGGLQTHIQQYNRLIPEDDALWLQKMDAAILVTHQPPGHILLLPSYPPTLLPALPLRPKLLVCRSARRSDAHFCLGSG